MMLSVSNNKLSVNDSFKEWVDKINTSLMIDFDLDYEASSGLTLVIKTGKFTEGPRIVNLPQTNVVVPANKTVLVSINTDKDATGFVVYEPTDPLMPTTIIPLFLVTSTTEITELTDIRTWANVSGSSGPSSGPSNGILVLDATITKDQTIATGTNALSVEPSVADGVTVTVENGSVWSIV